MKLKQNHLATLKRISEPRQEKQLTEGDQSQLALHTVRYLGELQQQGYCVQIGEIWHITDAGRKALNQEKTKKIERICALTMTERYDGAELRQLGNRPNAYQFINIPSRMHFGLVYRKDAVL